MAIIRKRWMAVLLIVLSMLYLRPVLMSVWSFGVTWQPESLFPRRHFQSFMFLKLYLPAAMVDCTEKTFVKWAQAFTGLLAQLSTWLQVKLGQWPMVNLLQDSHLAPPVHYQLSGTTNFDHTRIAGTTASSLLMEQTFRFLSLNPLGRDGCHTISGKQVGATRSNFNQRVKDCLDQWHQSSWCMEQCQDIRVQASKDVISWRDCFRRSGQLQVNWHSCCNMQIQDSSTPIVGEYDTQAIWMPERDFPPLQAKAHNMFSCFVSHHPD